MRMDCLHSPVSHHCHHWLALGNDTNETRRKAAAAGAAATAPGCDAGTVADAATGADFTTADMDRGAAVLSAAAAAADAAFSWAARSKTA